MLEHLVALGAQARGGDLLVAFAGRRLPVPPRARVFHDPDFVLNPLYRMLRPVGRPLSAPLPLSIFPEDVADALAQGFAPPPRRRDHADLAGIRIREGGRIVGHYEEANGRSADELLREHLAIRDRRSARKGEPGQADAVRFGALLVDHALGVASAPLPGVPRVPALGYHAMGSVPEMPEHYFALHLVRACSDGLKAPFATPAWTQANRACGRLEARNGMGIADLHDAYWDGRARPDDNFDAFEAFAGHLVRETRGGSSSLGKALIPDGFAANLDSCDWRRAPVAAEEAEAEPAGPAP